ncbi:MAG: heme-copper oxidase subunit III [Clostridia bacterium]|nr:heme-copper oxidase subunit III [Clostridia bacterium]
MSLSGEAVAAGPGHASHGHAHLTQSPEEKAKSYRTGVWLFMFSETMFFVAMIKVRFDLAGTARPAGLDQTFALVATAVLLLSAFTNWLALHRAKERPGEPWLWPVALTWVLGLAFGVLLVREWTALPVGAGDRYGSVFLGSLAFDLLHLAIGLVVFVSILVRGVRRRLDPLGSSLGLAGLYWYFVVLMWLVMYSVLYLV